jgi:hypothetical protein
MSFQHNNLGVYPVTSVPYGDDGKFRPVHVLRCMSQPPCKAELLINPGTMKRLPPHAIVKQAIQKGWHADRRGYCLCPEHTPWAKRQGQPSSLPPEQKRAAYCAIRERHMDAANDEPDRNEERAATVTPLHAEVIARAARDPKVTANRLDVLKALLPAIARADFTKGWRGRCAATIPMHETTFSNNVIKLIELGYLARIPNTLKLIVRRQPEQEETMRPHGNTDLPPHPGETTFGVTADPPRQPMLADNRRIREFLDSNYDEDAGRWCADLTDEAAAQRLKVPRAWVSTIRASLYGDDVNEAALQRSDAAAGLIATAAKLQEDALNLAARAEELEREARKLLG